MYEVISNKDRQRWEQELNQCIHKDVHAFYAYCDIYQKSGEGEPYLFVYKDEKGRKVYYAFLRRQINHLPFLSGASIHEDMYDITTPLGYGGPMYEHQDENLIRSFRIEFEKYCKKENIISEFVRFNPLLGNHQYLGDYMVIEYDKDTVYIDLAKDEGELISQYHKNHKRNIKKAKENKLQFKVLIKEEAIQHSQEFFQLYKQTMDKVGATPYYYFSLDYLKSLLSGLSENSMIGAVFFEGKMISAALCMYDNGVLYYHLGCSDKEYLALGINIFQFHNIALWGKHNGCQVFHLGGGYKSGDSLFEFKRRFCPEGLLPFHLGKKIHNLEMYKLLTDQWKKYNSDSQNLINTFFPAYRSRTIYPPKMVECP